MLLVGHPGVRNHPQNPQTPVILIVTTVAVTLLKNDTEVEDCRVENMILKEVRSNISQCPPLFTQESIEARRGEFVVNQYTEIGTVEDCDGNIFSSMSSVASNMTGYRIVVRIQIFTKKCVLFYSVH